MNLKGGQVPPAVCGNNADPILTGTASGGSGGGFRFKRLLSVAEAKRNIVECCQLEIRKRGGAAGVWLHGGNLVKKRNGWVNASGELYAVFAGRPALRGPACRYAATSASVIIQTWPNFRPSLPVRHSLRTRDWSMCKRQATSAVVNVFTVNTPSKRKQSIYRRQAFRLHSAPRGIKIDVDESTV